MLYFPVSPCGRVTKRLSFISVENFQLAHTVTLYAGVAPLFLNITEIRHRSGADLQSSCPELYRTYARNCLCAVSSELATKRFVESQSKRLPIAKITVKTARTTVAAAVTASGVKSVPVS